MPGKWNSLEFETGALQGTLESASSVLESIATLLKTVKAVVEAAEALLQTFESATKALINAVISIIEQTILNILETNAHVGFYSNLQFDTEWSWEPKDKVDPPNPNWENGDYPIDGTGMSGWLTTMTASTFDTTNLFRPITDSGTAVSGMILVTGAPSFSELGEFKELFAELLNFDDFKLKTQEEIEALGYDSRWKMVGGYFQSRLADLSEDLDEVESTYEEIKSQVDEQVNDPVPPADEVFLNSPGPTWVGLPIAALLGEPIRQTAAAFRRFVNAFTFADTPLTQLINAILKKIDQITELVELLNRLIESLIALLNFLESISFYYAAETSGGTKTFFRNAAKAENVPNFGVNGVVIGGAALTTHPTDVFESMISLLGANAQAAFSSVSTGAESFSATLDNVEDAAAEVEWQE
jgi:hypothetical protein